MGEKLKPKRDPSENEARQAARAAKRERAKDARTVAVIAAILKLVAITDKFEIGRDEAVAQAQAMLSAAKGE